MPSSQRATSKPSATLHPKPKRCRTCSEDIASITDQPTPKRADRAQTPEREDAAEALGAAEALDAAAPLDRIWSIIADDGDKDDQNDPHPDEKTGQSVGKAAEDQTTKAPDAELRASMSEGEVVRFWATSKFLDPTSDEEANHRWKDQCFYVRFDAILTAMPMFLHQFIRELTGSFTALVSWESLNPRSREYISSWAKSAQKYIDRKESTDRTSSIYTAWIYHILWDNLFSPECADKWSAPHWAAYDKARRDIEGEYDDGAFLPSSSPISAPANAFLPAEHLEVADNCFVRCFHQWRYISMQMLYTIHGSHTDPTRLQAILKDELQDLINASSSPSYFIDEAIARVVELAIEFDRYILCLKWKTTLYMEHPETHERFGFAYEPGPGNRTMKEMNGESDKRGPRQVDFVMSMGLQLHGKEMAGTQITYNRMSLHEYWVHDYAKPFARVPMKVWLSEFPDDEEAAEQHETEQGEGGQAEVCLDEEEHVSFEM